MFQRGIVGLFYSHWRLYVPDNCLRLKFGFLQGKEMLRALPTASFSCSEITSTPRLNVSVPLDTKGWAEISCRMRSFMDLTPMQDVSDERTEVKVRDCAGTAGIAPQGISTWLSQGFHTVLLDVCFQFIFYCCNNTWDLGNLGVEVYLAHGSGGWKVQECGVSTCLVYSKCLLLMS